MHHVGIFEMNDGITIGVCFVNMKSVDGFTIQVKGHILSKGHNGQGFTGICIFYSISCTISSRSRSVVFSRAPRALATCCSTIEVLS